MKKFLSYKSLLHRKLYIYQWHLRHNGGNDIVVKTCEKKIKEIKENFRK